MTKWFFLAAVGLMSGTAIAADLTGVDEPAAPAAPYDWSGAYIGVHGGYGWGEAGFDFVDVPNSQSETDIDGGFLGIQGGYNHQFPGGFVLGAEGDLAWSDLSGADPCPNPVISCTANLDWFGSVRARAGFGFARLLAYATGGLAVGDAEFDTSDGGLAVPGFDETSFGWTIGGGLEAALWRNWSAKLDYQFYDLGDETADVGDISGLSRTELDLDFHILKFGVNYRF